MSPAERAGPPEREEPGATPSTRPNHKSGIAKPTNQARPIAAGRQCRRNTVGRHADAVISPDHLAMLAASGITPEHAALRGYETITDKRRLAELKIVTAARSRVPGLLVPLLRADRSQWGYQYRPDAPRLRERQADQIRDAVAAAQRAGRTARRRADCSATRRYRCGSPRAPRRPTAGRCKGWPSSPCPGCGTGWAPTPPGARCRCGTGTTLP